MASPFTLQVVCPSGQNLEREVTSLSVTSDDGSLGVWAHHAPMLVVLENGPIIYKDVDGETHDVMIGGGILHVGDNRACVIADLVLMHQDG